MFANACVSVTEDRCSEQGCISRGMSQQQCQKIRHDNVRVHRAAANIIVSKSRAARGSVCNVLLSGDLPIQGCHVAICSFGNVGRVRLVNVEQSIILGIFWQRIVAPQMAFQSAKQTVVNE